MNTFDIVDQLAELDREIKSMQEQQKQLKASLVDEYKNQISAGIDYDDARTFQGSNIVAQITESEVSRFDSTKFKSANPDLYEEYIKKSTSISVRLKNA